MWLKLQVLLSIIFINANTFAQQKDCVKLIEPNKTWYISHYSRVFSNGVKNEIIKITHDTLLFGTTYYLVFNKYDNELQFNSLGYIRETYEGLVYYMRYKMDTILLYDYSKNIGDTLLSDRILANIDTISLPKDTCLLKKYSLKKVCNNNDTIEWVEGIGCLNGLLYKDSYYCTGDYIIRSFGVTIYQGILP